LNLESALKIPEDLKYSKTHEWVRIEGDIATIGVTDYAQSELGDIVYVDLPSVGRIVAEGDAFGTVESVKTVSDLYSPFSGEIVETNEALESRSELLNQDPYGSGWIIKLRIESGGDSLMDAASYSEQIKI
jgi:glycine cleavage system H protein